MPRRDLALVPVALLAAPLSVRVAAQGSPETERRRWSASSTSRAARWRARARRCREYRLLTPDDPDNDWPAMLDDDQRAVRWVRANAEEYVTDPERVCGYGHSAGRALAALLGLRETRDAYRDTTTPTTGPSSPRRPYRGRARPGRLHHTRPDSHLTRTA